MVAETDDREGRTEEPGETPPTDNALIAWMGAMHSELRAMRVEFREEQRETRRDLSERIDRVDARVGGVDARVGGVDRRVARIEGGVEAERDKKNKTIMWLGIGVGALLTAAGVAVGVISLLN